MPTVYLNGNKLYYVDHGKGRPLLFVHGLGGDHHLFDPQIAVFRQTHRVIAPHNRGNGWSGRLEGPPKRVLDQQCGDLAALIRYLGLERVVLCGISYGGVLGFHFVLSYPELVAGMVIADGFSDTRIAGLARPCLSRSIISPFGAVIYQASG